MARGGFRPNSGPPKGTKYKKRKTSATTTKKTKSTKPKKPPILPIPDDIKAEAVAENIDPLSYMLKVMNDPSADDGRRDRMAQYAAPYCHARRGEGPGKKEELDELAKKAGKGRFGGGRAPLALIK